MNKTILRLPRWSRILLLSLVALLAVFWLLGRFWLPEFARQKAIAALTETLHRPVAIGEIEIRPFALALTIRQFSIGQREARHGDAPLLAFDSLAVNLSSASLWYRAPVIRQISLQAPRVNLVRDADGRFNFSDLLETPAKEPAKETAATGLPDFSLSNIELSDGQIHFDDRARKTQTVVSELLLGVPFAGTIGTQEESWVEPRFRAKLDGSLFEMKGQIKPFADRREATMALRLHDLDLTRLVAYAPPVEGLKLLSARLDVNLDLSFVQPTGKPFSLLVKGDTALRQLAVEHRGGAPYVVSADRLGIQLHEFDATLAKPLRAALAIDQFALRAKNGKTPLLSLPKLSATDAVIDLKGKRADLAALDLERLSVDLRREKDGQIDLVRLLVPTARPPAVPRAEPKAAAGDSEAAAPAVGQGSPDPATPVAKATSSAPAWGGRITRIGLKDAGLRFADQSVDKAPPLLVEGLALAVEQLDLSGREPARVKLDARVNQRGRIAVDGTAAWAPLAVALRLDLAQLDLVPLQGWAGGQLNALLTKGAVSVAGQLNLAGQPAVARFEGDARLANFNLFDRVHTADVINFRSIELAGMRFVSAPFSVDLRRLSLDQFFARAILGEDGQLNLKQLAGTPPADKAEGGAVAHEPDVPASTAAAPAVGGSPAAETTRLPVRIDEIVIRKSRVDFSDQFIKPPYRASLTGLEGKITALAAGQRGLIDLRGQVDRSAPLAISGEVDPFGGQLFLNLAARVKGVDMPAMSPYAERYLGYELSKGKLSFDVKYLVDHGELKAENTLFLDQLTFGNKVESPEALSVPVTMAVALLKNTRGEIDLNLPVSGSLNDPEFSVARIVFKVLANLIVKAVTSPFALLGAAFGGGEELSQVDFSAGLASLDEGGEKRLTALSRALTERPALTLEITGHANPEQDRQALAKSLLDRQLRAQKLAASVKKGQDSAALREIVLSAEERSAAMMALASEQGVVVAKGAAATDYEAALLARVKIGDDELRQLAERRGRGVRNWLVETGKVPVERVFVMVPKLDLAGAAGLSGRAAFALR